MVLGKRVAIFDWEWGRNSAPRDGQKSHWVFTVCQGKLSFDLRSTKG